MFRQKVRISSPWNKTPALEIDMVVDSGATYTRVPTSLLVQLKVEKKYRRRLKIATGEVIERDAGEIAVTLAGETLTGGARTLGRGISVAVYAPGPRQSNEFDGASAPREDTADNVSAEVNDGEDSGTQGEVRR